MVTEQQLLISQAPADAARGWRFQRHLRLNSAWEYRRVFQCAIRCGDRAFTVLAHANQRDYARLGLAISKKCARRATARNHIKRLVRESFRAAQYELPTVDLVVMCRPVVNEMTPAELMAALQKHWQCVGKRCKKS